MTTALDLKNNFYQINDGKFDIVDNNQYEQKVQEQQSQLTALADNLIHELKSAQPKKNSDEIVQYTVNNFLMQADRDIGLPQELIKSAQTCQEQQSIFSKISQFLPSFSLSSLFTSLLTQITKMSLQSKEAAQEEQAAQLSETLTKLRVLGTLGSEEQLAILKNFKTNSEKDIEASLQRCFNRVSEYNGKLNASLHLHECIAKNDIVGAAQELYAHALITSIRKNNNNDCELTIEESQTLLAVDMALKNGASLKEYAPRLEQISSRFLALKWITKLPSVFAQLGSDIDIADLKKALLTNEPKQVRNKLIELLTPLSKKDTSISTETAQEVTIAKEMLASLSLFTDQTLITALGHQKLQEDFAINWKNKLTKFEQQLDQTSALTPELVKTLETFNEKLSVLNTSQKIARIAPSLIAVPLSTSTLVSRKISILTQSASETIKKMGTLLPKNISKSTLTASSNKPLNVSVWYFSCGNGHKACAENVQEYLEKSDKNTFKATLSDVVRDITFESDPIRNTLGKIWVDGTKGPYGFDSLFNGLMNNDKIKVIKWLKKLAGGSVDPTAQEVKRALLRERLLQEQPELLVVTYTLDLEDITAVADELGIPVMHIATDFDASAGFNVQNFKHFKRVVPTKENSIAKETMEIGQFIKDEQIEEIGLPVKLDFERKFTSNQLQDLKQELNIQKGEKVIVVSSGGGGLANDLPEYLSKHYKDEKTPIRIIVLTGRNEKFKDKLEKKIVPQLKNNKAVQMTVLGFRKDMPKIFNVADLLVGKGGGMTTYEARKMMLPMIVDETTNGFFSERMDWEKINADVMIEDKLGNKISKTEEIVDAVTDMLSKERPQKDALTKKKASEAIVDLALNMLDSKEDDIDFSNKRKVWMTA